MRASELRARWQLAVVVCALAAHAEVQGWPDLQCEVNTSPHCLATNNPEIFMIYGQKHTMRYLNGTFEASCTVTTLDENIWPSFPVRVGFKVAILRNCFPPKAYLSYVSALLSLNISVSETLRILDVPPQAVLTSDSLYEGPPSLELAPKKKFILDLQASALRGLNYLRTLTLNYARFEMLPANLENLYIRATGVTILNPNSFDNLAGNVKITLDGLNTLTVKVPRVCSLKISSKVLFVLTVSEAPVPSLGPGFLNQCYWLDTVELNHLFERDADKQKLPSGLLGGLNQMWKFYLTESDVAEIPQDLFADTQNLREIHMTKNKLKSIPYELFAGLNELMILDLAENNIFFPDLRAIRNILRLDQLILRGSRFGSICPKGGQSMLSELNLGFLDISQANLDYICQDWLLNMRRMYVLNLTHNSINSLNCSDLKISRTITWHGKSIISVYNNPIAMYECTKEDHDRIVQGSVAQHTELIIPQLSCNCDGYWMKRTLEAQDVQVSEMRPATCLPQTCP